MPCIICLFSVAIPIHVYNYTTKCILGKSLLHVSLVSTHQTRLIRLHLQIKVLVARTMKVHDNRKKNLYMYMGVHTITEV